jgi:hypothetical protein
MELYFEQLTPLVILSQTAEETGKTVAQVEDETNKSLENPATTEDITDQSNEDNVIIDSNVEMERFTMPTSLSKEYEIYKS